LPPAVFDGLDFIYFPSRDVAGEMEVFTDGLGAELVFAIEAFGTRVAMVRLSPDPPACCSRVTSRATGPSSSTALRTSIRPSPSWKAAPWGCRSLEIPHGPGAELTLPGPQRVALSQLTRPQATHRLEGRSDL
jgi:hypothetical protein